MRTPRELAEAWREALLARDADAFAALFAADGVMLDVEHRTPDGRSARPLEGRDEIRSVTAAWCSETPAFTYDLLDVLAAGDRAAVRWRYAVGGLELEGVSWLECADGCILRAFVSFDIHELLTSQ